MTPHAETPDGGLVPAPARERRHRLFWWKEALIAFAFYTVYSAVRNQFGSARVIAGEPPMQAFNNAMRVIRLERATGLFHEETVQDWFLPFKWFIQFWNTYYGTAHFIVTFVAFVVLYRKLPRDFPLWRNTLGAATALAILGFAFFPVMPPRLLNDTGPFGGNEIAAERGIEGFGFVDTLEEYGGPWSFESGTMEKISNQYAAMPSLHIGWSSWVALALWPLAASRWQRLILVLYPATTLFCIVVTANHYWLDGVGGQVALLCGYLIGRTGHRWNQRRLDSKYAPAPPVIPTNAGSTPSEAVVTTVDGDHVARVIGGRFAG
jgi:hypothetical protein